MNNSDLAKQILAEIIHINIATCDANGQPWNTPVYTAYDDDFNFYWTSDKSNQHSQNIRSNPRVFIVVYDSTGAFGNKTAVYIEATARELNDPEEIRQGRYYTQTRKGNQPDGHKEFVGDKTRRVYQATPIRTWLNDAEFKDGDFLRDYRVEIKLK